MIKQNTLPGILQRNSSVELYRILAALAVLIVHFNGWFVGGLPESYDFNSIFTYRTSQVLIQSSTCICVNMFILISGYFSIKLKVKSIVNLCIKLFLIFVPFYVVSALLEGTFSISSLVYNMLVISRAGYFIQCYIMLMLLSPILNCFVEKYRNQLWQFCLLLIFVEFWFGCIMSTTLGLEDNLNINHGYSVFHFVTIYLLGRCVNFYSNRITTVKKEHWVMLYWLCTFSICLMHMLNVKFAFHYSNPVVVLSSICSFIPFIYFDYHNKLINWTAGSALTVYIISSATQLVPLLMRVDVYLLNNYCYVEYLSIIAFLIVLIFIFCVLYDKLCSFVANPLIKKVVMLVEGTMRKKKGFGDLLI